MKYKPIALLDIGQGRDDVYTASRKHNQEIEHIYDILNNGAIGSGSESTGGSGLLTFKTMDAIKE